MASVMSQDRSTMKNNTPNTRPDKRQALRLMLQGRIDAYLQLLTRKPSAHGLARG